ncbi:hypothetical protein N0V93_007880 [Gnomoniopsis smithogilvyi]|uniref:DUF6594 domain-containing protein n=1 Tax=Gnomoniopsis smithogilvyi TaxID=1191159 RepID=A0A9W8YM58_9PEZI|nr:hypothetical protein N0V93_007880 [Gnomoniopsis smithogilvyi]
MLTIIIVDKYRSGYPRYTTLLSTHPSFHNFRRFTKIRMRLLLLQQDRITRLEDRLDLLDSQESQEIFLGCVRRDVNPDRLQVFEDLAGALKVYDDLLERSCQVLSLPKSWNRDIENLKRWTDGTGCISRKETEYLEKGNDLANLIGSFDSALVYSESIVEDCTSWFSQCVSNYIPGLRRRKHGSNNKIWMLGPQLQRFSRILAVVGAIATIWTPALILPSVHGLAGRLLGSLVSASIFMSVLSFFTKASTMEIVSAGASYAAVLVAVTVGNPTPTSICCPQSS